MKQNLHVLLLCSCFSLEVLLVLIFGKGLDCGTAWGHGVSPEVHLKAIGAITNKLFLGFSIFAMNHKDHVFLLTYMINPQGRKMTDHSL